MWNPLFLFNNGYKWLNSKYKNNHAVLAPLISIPVVILRNIDMLEIPWKVLCLLMLIYILCVSYKLYVNKDIALSKLLFSYTIKGHNLFCPMFWLIIGGVLGNTMAFAIQKQQMKLDNEEFNIAYGQYSSTYMQLLINDDITFFPIQDREFAQGLKYLMDGDFPKSLVYMKAASSEYAYASYIYGSFLYSGFGVNPQKIKAIDYLTEAAEKEIIEAKLYLMRHYARYQKYDLVEHYGMDIINKYSFKLPPANIYINADPTILQAASQKCIETVFTQYYQCVQSAYNMLLSYYWASSQYDKAIDISEKMDNSVKGNIPHYKLNKALSILQEGDRSAARKCFKKIIGEYEFSSDLQQLATNTYIEYMYINTDFNPRLTFCEAKKAESMLIKNIKIGNRKSVSLIMDLYSRLGYTNQYEEMSHLDSYYKMLDEYER